MALSSLDGGGNGMPTMMVTDSSSPGKSMPSATDPPRTEKKTPLRPDLNLARLSAVLRWFPDSSQYLGRSMCLSRYGRMLRM